jgi:hypothetical protein
MDAGPLTRLGLRTYELHLWKLREGRIIVEVNASASSAVGGVLLALAAPFAAELTVMQPSQKVRVMVEAVRGTNHVVIVVAVIARGCPLLRPLADDVELLTAQLHNFSQRLL